MVFQVQLGKGKGSYKTKWTFKAEDEKRARFYFACINAHSGFKKRLVAPDGTVVARVLT